MKIKKAFMQGSVARRIFVLFVLAAFLPMLLMALLTYSQVRSLITEQAHIKLVAQSKNFAMAVDQRLIVAQGNLSRLALLVRQSNSLPSTQVLESLHGHYSGLTLASADLYSTPLLGDAITWPVLNKSEQGHLAEGGTVLIVQSRPVKSPHIFMVQKIGDGDPDHFALIAQLNPAELWGTEEDFPYMTGLCMFAGDIALFCSQPDMAMESAKLAHEMTIPTPVLQVQIGGETRITGHWELFLKPQFDTAPSWTALAAQPLSVALLPVTQFSRIFIGVMVLALLLVMLLSVNQIRRTMGPLAKLIKGTRRVADEDFAHRVDVASGDEFGELATSFNEMAARLGNQLGILKVLSSIDQVILSKQDIDSAFGLVLSRIRTLTPADFAGIVVLEEDAPREARIYFLKAGQAANVEMDRVRVDAEALQTLAGQGNSFWIEGSESCQNYIPHPELQHAQRLLIFPVLAEAALRAFVCLEIARHEAVSPQIMTQVQDLGDRIGVALSAAARDEQLIYQARHDDLTGLPNRLLFKERLASEISFARRDGGKLALLFVDLDRFKNINDTLGHSAGDELLKEAAQRLRRYSRESDTVARLGGDEFAIILPNITGVHGTTTVAEHIVDEFEKPFVIAGHESHISASIGVAIWPTDADSSESLLMNADTAMYRAKETGRGRFVYFEGAMNADAIEQVALEREMRQGLPRGEFVLHYQPKLDLRTGKISGAEALVRWNHPIRGFVSPGVFIGIAEHTGLIEEMGRGVIGDVCTQHALMRAAGINAPRIAVNVSMRQFKQGNLIQIIQEMLQKTFTPPEALEIEVTESLFMGDIGDVSVVLNELRRMGVKVAIDDFGTGYSSMSYLRQLPVDVIKIDKSFIDDIADDDGARAIAKVIIDLAHTLDKSVVAEGVETLEQLNLLREWQCDVMQGYYFSKPLPPENFAQFVLANQ